MRSAGGQGLGYRVTAVLLGATRTVTLVFALHSRNKHPLLRAKFIPSSWLTLRPVAALSTLLPMTIFTQSCTVLYMSTSRAHTSPKLSNVSRL